VQVLALDAADQVTERRALFGTEPLERFAYDGAGRLVQRQAPDGTPTETYAYDGLGRLVSMTRASDGYSLALEYGPEGRRRERTEIPGGVARYFRGGLEVRGGEKIRLVRGEGIDAVVAEVAGTTVRGLARDGTGNVTQVTESGSLSFTRRYEAFGGRIEATGSAPVERGFAGAPTEGSSGLVYMRARHYDPRLGRFLQPDPLGIDADQLYAYARSNPYRFFDPLGLDPIGLLAETLATIGNTPVSQPVAAGFGGAAPGFQQVNIPGLGVVDIANPLLASLDLVSDPVFGEAAGNAVQAELGRQITRLAAVTLAAQAFVMVAQPPRASLGATTAFRVEGATNQRLFIGVGGEVRISGSNTLFLNFGDAARAESFLVKRLGQGFSDSTIKSFQVPTSFVDDLAESAVPENLARQFPNSPLVVDVGKAANQFGLRPAQIEALQKAIIQGTGR
jgi:RHS repeat-associated protein